MAAELSQLQFDSSACLPAFNGCDQKVLGKLRHLVEWPAVSDFHKIFHQSPLPFTGQINAQLEQAGGYEAFIKHQQQIPTRAHNMHDLMNALVWHSFPLAKLTVHQLQCRDGFHKQRSRLQNACTLFDECGMLLISENPDYQRLIQEHQWAELFWQRRTELTVEARFIVFGHALLEKCLQPYRGVCGQLLWLQHRSDADCTTVDASLSQLIHHTLQSPDDLLALPLLGIPDWDPANQQAAYYDDTDYFRPLSSRQ